MEKLTQNSLGITMKPGFYKGIYMNMRFILLLTLCLQACAGTVTTSPDTTQQLPDQPKSQAELVAANNAMAGALFLLLPESDENVFFSPISLTAAFGLAHPGAAGKTAREMEQLFGFTDARTTGDLMADLQSDNELAKLIVANAAWITDRYPVKQTYLDMIRKYMRAQIEALDFTQAASAAGTINDWVKDKTNSRIDKLISARMLNDQTGMVLTNAVWFKAKWAQMKHRRTYKGTFYATGETQQADLMEFRGATFRYAEEPLFQAIDLNYKGGQFAMSIILPKEKDGLAAVEAAMSNEKLAKTVLSLEHTKQEYVSLTMPKITVEAVYDLIKHLRALGVEHAFHPKKANFDGIFIGSQHHISNLVQKTYLAIDEIGTEAAAATGMTMETVSGRMSKKFIVTHPYLLTIRHRPTGTIIFAGRIADIDSINGRNKIKYK